MLELSDHWCSQESEYKLVPESLKPQIWGLCLKGIVLFVSKSETVWKFLHLYIYNIM